MDKVLELASQGEWENVIHAHLAAGGSRLRFAPEARIRQNLRYAFQAFCRDRYEHGRDYARRRLQDEGRRRWLYLPGALVLPPLQTLRVARATDPRNHGVFLRALPFTFAFLAAWFTEMRRSGSAKMRAANVMRSASKIPTSHASI